MRSSPAITRPLGLLLVEITYCDLLLHVLTLRLVVVEILAPSINLSIAEALAELLTVYATVLILYKCSLLLQLPFS